MTVTVTEDVEVTVATSVTLTVVVSATVTVADGTHASSSGDWSSTGLSWTALAHDSLKYEIIVASDKMHVQGRFTLTSVSAR